MKQFTAKGKLKHWDDVDERLIVMADGDTLSLRDGLVEFFCAHGWGTAPGVESAEPKPGHVILSAGNPDDPNRPPGANPRALTEEHAELMRRPDAE